MDNLLEVKLLGNPQVNINGVPVAGFRSAKTQALLYYLAATGRPHPRAALAGLFWSDVAEQHARRSLTSTLSNLRQLVGDFLDITRNTVAFTHNDACWVDIDAFDTGVSAKEITTLQQAIALYEGDFLEGFYIQDAPEFEQWVLHERTHRREAMLRTLQKLAGELRTVGDLDGAMRYLRRVLSREPWREEVHRQLMFLLAQSGQRSAALAQYEQCVQMLAAELDVTPDEETEALVRQIRAGAIAQVRKRHDGPLADVVVRPRRVDPPLATGATSASVTQPVALNPGHAESLDQVKHALPASVTPFVGREQEIAEILHRIQDPDCRLLTLVGPGGIGKTRLALAAAEQLMPHTADGVYFVPLQPIGSVSALPAAIANAIGFRFYANTNPQEQLTNYLSQKQMLLILDNFEHLLEGVTLISHLLAHAPHIKLIATSRAALRIQEEWFHPISGLHFPANTQFTKETVDGYDAVELFTQSARRASVNFSLEAEYAHVVRICRLVDGLPLGIELAAAWLRVLSCAQVVDEIARGMDILTTRQQNVPERHRSIRAVWEQTWQMLTAEQQLVLGRLSVLRGGFDRVAADQVADASLPTLVELIEKSLIHAGDDGRYQMHELLRQFAAEMLATEPAATAATQDRHSHYYLAFVHRLEPLLTGREQSAALEKMEAEIDNVTAAWRWAVAQGNHELIGQACDGIYHFFTIRSRYIEGAELFETALRQVETAQPTQATGPINTVPINTGATKDLLARLLSRQAAFNLLRGDFEPAAHCLQRSLAGTSDVHETAFALNMLSEVHYAQGLHAEAEAAAQQSLDLCRGSTNRHNQALGLYKLADAIAASGRPQEAKAWAEQGVALCRQLARPDWIAQSLSMLAWCVNALGNNRLSEIYWREALTLFRQIDDQMGVGLVTNHLAWVAWCISDQRLSEAVALSDQGLQIMRNVGHKRHLSMCLADAALLRIELQEYDMALNLARETVDIAAASGIPSMHAYGLSSMGAAAGYLGDFDRGRIWLQEGIEMASQIPHPDILIYAFYRLALLLLHEAEMLRDRKNELSWPKIRQARELLRLIQLDTKGWPKVRAKAQQALTQTEEMLAPQWRQSSGQPRLRDKVTAEIISGEFFADLAPAT